VAPQKKKTTTTVSEHDISRIQQKLEIVSSAIENKSNIKIKTGEPKTIRGYAATTDDNDSRGVRVW